MIIGIDGNEANQKNRVGVGQFAYQVISQLEKIDQKGSYFVYLKEKVLPDLPTERDNWKYKIFGPSKLWTQIAFPIKLFTQREKLDIIFSPSHYGPRFSTCPVVISIMDLWHHRHPEQFTKKDLYQLTKWEGYSVKKAAHIITISEFSKEEILDIYHVSQDKVTVAYPGFNNFQFSIFNFQSNLNSKILNVKNKYKINGEYLLYIGTLQPKKNIERLIKAFSLLIANYQSPITLVIAGKKGWLYENIFSEVEKLNLQKKVIFTDFVAEEEKPYLISGAKAFVFPSLYEGFGIPVLEAMSLGVPVVTSREGSLPEVAGEAAIYCNPYSISDIALAINKVLNLKKGERDEIIRLGLNQCEKFSWEKTAREILSVLENVLRF